MGELMAKSASRSIWQKIQEVLGPSCRVAQVEFWLWQPIITRTTQHILRSWEEKLTQLLLEGAQIYQAWPKNKSRRFSSTFPQMPAPRNKTSHCPLLSDFEITSHLSPWSCTCAQGLCELPSWHRGYLSTSGSLWLTFSVDDWSGGGI